MRPDLIQFSEVGVCRGLEHFAGVFVALACSPFIATNNLFEERCRCRLATLVSSKATFATGCSGFLATPLMGATFLVRNPAPFAGNLTLLLAVHRREPSIFFAHSLPLGTPLESVRTSRRDMERPHAGLRDELCNAHALPTEVADARGDLRICCGYGCLIATALSQIGKSVRKSVSAGLPKSKLLVLRLGGLDRASSSADVGALHPVVPGSWPDRAAPAPRTVLG